MLDDDHRVATADEFFQDRHEYADVLEVQPRCRLVEDVECLACVAFAELCSKFHALALTAGERRRALSEFDVSESHVLQCFDLRQDGWHVLEEFHGLVDRHVEHVGYGLAFVAHLQCLAVVAFAVTHLTGYIDVGHEVHLYRLVAVAAASLAAAALDIEREASRLVATDLSLRQFHKQIADVAKYSRVGGWIGAWRTADRTLVDVDNLVDVVNAVDAVVGHRLLQRTIEVLRQDGL